MRFRILAETVSRICEAASRGSASVGCETIHFDKVQSLPFRCLGVWGPSDDLWQFLIEKLRLPSSGKTEVGEALSLHSPTSLMRVSICHLFVHWGGS